MKYFIGFEGFKTKSSALLYVKAKLNDIRTGEYTKETEEYDFIMSILKNHSHCDDKIGCGISHFIVVNLSKGKHISFIREDDTHDDFSYNHCCEFRPKGWKESNRLALTSALRLSIYPQIKKFWIENRSVQQCLKCNIKFSPENKEEIDHIYPFSCIVDDFLKINTHKIPTDFINAYNGKYLFKDEDKEFEIDFISYHEKKAKYQILCQKCNLKKSNSLEV